MARPSLSIDERTRDVIRARMERKGWTAAEISRRTSSPVVDASTVRAVLSGARRTAFADTTLSAISRALDWPPNGIARLIRGDNERDLLLARIRGDDAADPEDDEQSPSLEGAVSQGGNEAIGGLTPAERRQLEGYLRVMREEREEAR